MGWTGMHHTWERILVCKSKGKRPFGIPGRKLEDNIEVYLQDVGSRYPLMNFGFHKRPRISERGSCDIMNCGYNVFGSEHQKFLCIR